MNPIVMAPTVLPDAHPLDYLNAAVAADYRSIGLRLHRSLVMPFVPVVGDPALTAEIKRIVRDNWIDVLEITSFYLVPEMDYATIEGALELGAELGGRIALVIGADRDWSRAGDSLGRMCEIAARYGMTCAIENAPNAGLASVADIVRMIEEVGVGNAGLCLDPVNHISGGGTPEDLARLPRRYFPYTQLADAIVGPGTLEYVDGRQKHIPRRLYGDGNMPLFAILDALPEGVPISIELQKSIATECMGEAEPTDAAWALRTREATEQFLAAYHAQRSA